LERPCPPLLANSVQARSNRSEAFGGLLNCFRHRITTASLESFNSKLKVMTGNACGYRNMDNFKRMILGIRELNPASLHS
jgi:transposase